MAIGVCRAIRKLYPEEKLMGFLVSSFMDNPRELEGMKVQEIHAAAVQFSDVEKKQICVYIATPEIVHREIIKILERYGFVNYKGVNSRMEANLMEKYYREIGRFPSLHQLFPGKQKADMDVYSAQFYKDKKLDSPPVFPDYVHSLLLGCANYSDEGLERKVGFCDNTGEHISEKNSDYCEMTAYYWVWKNRLREVKNYVGIYHYRRMLDISEEDQARLVRNDVDVVLPFPMIHLPDIREHHTRYMKENEWEAMLIALGELYPDYAEAFKNIFSGEYFYNYNMMVAKKEVFADYCAWLFPLLFRTEELVRSEKAGWTVRYNAYISESLLTLYFFYHRELKIYHTGRLVFT